ncbi:hypothetical protein [Paludisphaera rhizosphaerae]|uniref:hypothetical protein n=1 Tax=Paludisphaera rhizosphaerae TaxID=2711216 RepID=UPI0013EDF11B|nr:hypothetical protein [Paludisphaera rhizosphaerae]
MNTDEATKALAEIYLTGESDTRAEREAECHLWQARERAEAEDWDTADYSLDAAYHALGAESHPEATADDLSRRKHSIRVEAERLSRDAFGEE